MGNGDVPYDAPPSPRTTSIRSFTAPRPGITYPPRSDSLRSGSDHTAASVSGDERVIPSIVVHDQRSYPISPLASPIIAAFPQPQVQAAGSPLAGPTRTAPPPPVPRRSRQRSSSATTARSTSQAVTPQPSSGTLSRQTSTSSSQPDIAAYVSSPKKRTPSRQTSTSSSQHDIAARGGSPKKGTPSLLEAGRSSTPLSMASQDDAPPTTSGGITHRVTPSSSNMSFTTANGDTSTPRTTSPHSTSRHTPSPSTASSQTAAARKRASSRSGSVSYSAFPSCAPREHRTSDSISARRRSSSRRRDQIGSRGTPDPTPVVNREDAVETHVTTKVLPGKSPVKPLTLGVISFFCFAHKQPPPFKSLHLQIRIFSAVHPIVSKIVQLD
jgi:hypothetical protein